MMHTVASNNHYRIRATTICHCPYVLLVLLSLILWPQLFLDGWSAAAGSVSARVLLAVAGCVVLSLRLLMLKVPLLLILRIA
jgi:hypothetical protein